MRLIALTIVAFLLGCSSTTEPDRVRVLGAIAGFNEGDPQIQIVPDDQTVTVRVTTYGNGCYSKGETEAVVEGLEATVTPWDSTVAPRSGVACTEILLSFTHEAVLDFDEAGTARIAVRGMDRSSGSTGKRGEETTIERFVEVP